MIYVKNNKIKNFKLTLDNFFVMLDFDRTLTTSDSMGSWAVLENPNFMNPDFKNASTKLKNKYYPYELDYSLDEQTKFNYMAEWYQNNMDLLFNFNLTHNILLNCVKNSNLKLRAGSKEFLEQLYTHNIPVVILSAGIGNVINEFLSLNNCLFPNMHIFSNFIEFENDNMLAFNSSIIHTSNKSIKQLPIDLRMKLFNKKHILLFGDLIEDLNMVSKEDLNRTICFGFLEENVDKNLEKYKNAFDIVLTDNSSFEDVQNVLNNIIKDN